VVPATAGVMVLATVASEGELRLCFVTVAPLVAVAAVVPRAPRTTVRVLPLIELINNLSVPILM